MRARGCKLPSEHGGLGLRSLSQHCHAAYLASRSSCHALCKDLDPAHTFQSGSGSEPTPERLAFDNYNSSVNDDSRLPMDFIGELSQKELSKAIDHRSKAMLSSPHVACQSRQAHLSLVSASHPHAIFRISVCKPIARERERSFMSPEPLYRSTNNTSATVTCM